MNDLLVMWSALAAMWGQNKGLAAIETAASAGWRSVEFFPQVHVQLQAQVAPVS